ncbi:hypothetical protein QJS04_geneDACA022745 [Acorus gramineus]|uniref:Thioredoxin domain-containing protein n=1 Tax=Acorus gramineus TaxID=55184 RepID=A0AAV9AI20_ACOGR|nr:hypothetical protein QJS04_geneDACA022745 [Acorus gramineus]
MTAVSSTPSVASANLGRSIFLESPKLASSSSSLLRCPLHRSLRPRNLRVSSAPPRRILPVVKATKQTFSTFDEMLENSDKPVLVDFYATWCGPCQIMTPILNQVSGALNDKIQVVKIDTEKYPSIANRYSIQALPTFIIFRDGEPCDRFEGALPADQLIQRIEHALKATTQ